MTNEILIIIPTYNEIANLSWIVASIQLHFDRGDILPAVSLVNSFKSPSSKSTMQVPLAARMRVNRVTRVFYPEKYATDLFLLYLEISVEKGVVSWVSVICVSFTSHFWAVMYCSIY